MSYQTLNAPYQSAPVRQLVLILTNAKYSYAQFSYFHETVLNLLGADGLLRMTEKQQRNTLFFMDVILSLLDTPKRSVYAPQREYNLSVKDPELHPVAVCKANLELLLSWIDEVVGKKEITIQALLDEFYHIKFSLAFPKS